MSTTVARTKPHVTTYTTTIHIPSFICVFFAIPLKNNGKNAFKQVENDKQQQKPRTTEDIHICTCSSPWNLITFSLNFCFFFLVHTVFYGCQFTITVSIFFGILMMVLSNSFFVTCIKIGWLSFLQMETKKDAQQKQFLFGFHFSSLQFSMHPKNNQTKKRARAWRIVIFSFYGFRSTWHFIPKRHRIHFASQSCLLYAIQSILVWLKYFFILCISICSTIIYQNYDGNIIIVVAEM